MRVLATHFIRQFPFHFPSRASPCAIRFQTHSTYSKCSASQLRTASNRNSKIPRTTLRLQVELERTHRQKKKTNRLTNKRVQLVGRKKKSLLSIENKLLIYKPVIKPIWSCGLELWGCASKSNIVIKQRSETKILRATANAPRYVTNHTLHIDFNIHYVSDVIHERINKHHNNLEAHPNPLLEPLIQSINTTRLKRCWPLDLQST